MKEITYLTARRQADFIEDSNCCAVIAVAIATQRDYREIYLMLEELGREDGQACSSFDVFEVLARLGYLVPHRAYKACSLKKIQEQLDPNKVYLVSTKDHVACIRDGQLEDHGKDSLKRVTSCREVVFQKDNKSFDLLTEGIAELDRQMKELAARMATLQVKRVTNALSVETKICKDCGHSISVEEIIAGLVSRDISKVRDQDGDIHVRCNCEESEKIFQKIYNCREQV